MTFAVIKTGGKQYKVAANDVVKIEKIEAEAGDVVTFDQVLMVGEGDDVTVGAPLVEGALVAGHFIATEKQRTVIILKKHRRQHYDRRNGHRQRLSTVRITEILTGGAKPTTAVDEKLKARAAAQAEAAAMSVSGEAEADGQGRGRKARAESCKARGREARQGGQGRRSRRPQPRPAKAKAEPKAKAPRLKSRRRKKPAAKKARPRPTRNKELDHGT